MPKPAARKKPAAAEKRPAAAATAKKKPVRQAAAATAKKKPAAPARKAKKKPAAPAKEYGARADLGAPVEGFFAKQPAALREILESLRALVVEVVPDAQSSIKWGMPVYTVAGAMVRGWLHTAAEHARAS